jgi:hypothetical protein
MTTTDTAALRTPVNWTSELAEQLDFHWRVHLRPRLDGLGDAELHWEPVPGCWGIRPRGQAVTPLAAGAGDWVADFAYPEPEPAPVTTIAWRLGHISVGCLAKRAADHFGAGGVDYETTDWPGKAEATLAALDDAYRAWMEPVRRLTPEELARPVGPAEGPWATKPMAALVLHITREVLHHGAEVLLLRDLYRAGGGQRPGR